MYGNINLLIINNSYYMYFFIFTINYIPFMENSKNNINKIKTILIAGGAGFIGSNLCRRLLRKIIKLFVLIIYLQVK